MIQAPDHLNDLFISGSKITDLIIGEIKTIGTVILPTGSVVACDPFTLFDAAAFERKVKPGEYQVVATLLENYDKRPIAVTLKIKEGAPVKWMLALKPGQSLDDDTLYGYPVDAGTGAFMDKVTAEKLDQDPKFIEKNIGFNFDEYASATVDPETKANIVVFHSGFGDGVYCSWWGFNENDEVVCLTTDFV